MADVKTITKPSVYLVGHQTVGGEELSRFLSDHGVSWETDTEVGAEALCETAGRVCYMSFAKPRPGGNAAYLGHIKEVGHGSVLEHAVWNFIFTGVSRSLTHELVRHRAGLGFSQLSQRYVDESVAEYVVPPDLQLELGCYQHALASGRYAEGPFPEKFIYPLVDEAIADADRRYPLAKNLAEEDPEGQYREAILVGLTWVKAVRHAHDAYVKLSAYLAEKWLAADAARVGYTRGPGSGGLTTEGRKFARQAARSVLPNATETKIFVTANARAFRHFIEMRASRHADPEIRVLAHTLWKVLVANAPNLFGDYQEIPLSDGTVELTTTHRKV